MNATLLASTSTSRGDSPEPFVPSAENEAGVNTKEKEEVDPEADTSIHARSQASVEDKATSDSRGSGAAGRDLEFSSTMDVELGAVLDDKYRLRREVGAGGMGVVYRAYDERLERDVAIKIVHPQLSEDTSFCTQLIDEARHMAQLRHPNVMEIYDVGEFAGRPYLVMPYVAGMDLRMWARQGNRLPASPATAVGIMGQVCSGVAAMHEIGIGHYDIKPTNILVSSSLEVMLADLGVAQRFMAREPSEYVSGTIGFLAPEFLRQQKIPGELVHKADIYALGVTAYWLLVGGTPWGDRTLSEIAHRQLEGDFKRPSAACPELSDRFDAPILAAMDLDPGSRPEANELREALFKARDTCAKANANQELFIVILDDDFYALDMVKTIVKGACPGAEVVTTANPRSALSLIESRPPDLIICDLDMPGINGVEVAASIRGFPSTEDVPIVMITGVGGAEDWALLRNIGVNEFLLKPIVAETLDHVITRRLDLKVPASP